MDSTFPPPMPRLRVTADEGRQARPAPGHLSALLLAHGSLELRWFGAPPAAKHHPHDRDEVDVIVSGTGVFVRAEERHPFGDDGLPAATGEERVTVGPGDTLFVPAGTIHQFEVVSPDFGAWMIFYGPEGGERSGERIGEAIERSGTHDGEHG